MNRLAILIFGAAMAVNLVACRTSRDNQYFSQLGLSNDCVGCGPRMDRVEIFSVGDNPDSPYDWITVAESVSYPDFMRRSNLDGYVLVDVLPSMEGLSVARSAELPVDSLGNYIGGDSFKKLFMRAALSGIHSHAFTPNQFVGDSVRVRVVFKILRSGAG